MPIVQLQLQISRQQVRMTRSRNSQVHRHWLQYRRKAVVTVLVTLKTWATRLRPDVHVGRSAAIWPGTRIASGVAIGSGCQIGLPRDPRNYSWGNHGATILGPDSHIRSHTTIYENTVCGTRLETSHGVVVREGCRIGDDVYLKAHTYVGSSCHLGGSTTVAGLVGDRSTLHHGATSLGSLVHRSQGPHRGEIEPGPTVEAGAFIGREAIVVGGVKVGQNAYINSGVKITRDVEANTIVRR